MISKDLSNPVSFQLASFNLHKLMTLDGSDTKEFNISSQEMEISLNGLTRDLEYIQKDQQYDSMDVACFEARLSVYKAAFDAVKQGYRIAPPVETHTQESAAPMEDKDAFFQTFEALELTLHELLKSNDGDDEEREDRLYEAGIDLQCLTSDFNAIQRQPERFSGLLSHLFKTRLRINEAVFAKVKNNPAGMAPA